MSVAAHPFKVYVKSTIAAPSGPDELDGIKDVSVSSSKTMLDTTDFKDTTGAKTKLAGLEDGAFSVSGDYEAADAPQLLIRSSFDSGATIYLTVHVDPNASSGQKGYQYPCLVESWEAKGAIDGLGEFSASFTQNGAKVAV